MANHRGINDSGEFFVIDPVSRKVNVPHAHKSIGVVGDHCSEQVRFECPQKVDGHDVSQCAMRYVTWVNVSGDRGHDELMDAEVENGAEGMIYLSWTIRKPLTHANGVVQFSLHFEDLDDEGNLLYHWGTSTCKDCEILDGINATMRKYEAIYVAGETLVFSDYTPVHDENLELESNGLDPKGTLPITENGNYPVGEYAEVSVNVPTERAPVIEVKDKGLIVASDGTGQNVATYQLIPPVPSVDEDGTVKATSYGMVETRPLTSFDANGVLTANNIKEGVNIFGVEGALSPVKRANLTLDVTNSGESAQYTAFVTGAPEASFNDIEVMTYNATGYFKPFSGFSAVKGGMVTVIPPNGFYFTDNGSTDVEMLYESTSVNGAMVFMITGDNPTIKMTYKRGY